VHEGAQPRQLEHQLDVGRFQLGLDAVPVDLLDDQRHRHDHDRPQFGERGQQHLRGGHLLDEGHVAAGEEWRQEVERAAEGVRQRQERDDPVARVQRHVVDEEPYVHHQRPVRQHDALGEAGGARGVDDRGQTVRGHRRQLQVPGREGASVGIVGSGQGGQGRFRPTMRLEQRREVAQAGGRLDRGHLLAIDGVGRRVGQEEHPAAAVADDVLDLGAGEVGQDRHDDRAARDRRQIDHGPVRAVAAHQSHAVAGADLQRVEHAVQAGDQPRHVPAGQGGAVEIAEAGNVPVPAQGLADAFDEVLADASVGGHGAPSAGDPRRAL